MGRFESTAAHSSGGGRELPPRVQEFLEEAAEWARGKMWVPRALLLAYLVYADFQYFRDPLHRTLFSGITLAFHEMGHLLFNFAGHFIGSLMGSGMQILIPLIVVIVFYRQSDFFGMAVGGFWFSFSLFELATYVADARAMELPLVGFTDDPEHDWHYLLSTLGILNLDTTLAFLIRLVATVSGVASLAFAVWLLLVMARSKSARALA
jgi:hypothetical protein